MTKMSFAPLRRPRSWAAALAGAMTLSLALGTLAACSSEEAETSSDTEVVALTTGTGYADVDNMDFEYTEREQDASYDEASATKISLGAATDGSLAVVDGQGATADAESVSISAEGVYVIEGQATDGQVRVAVADDVKVQLVLDDVVIHNEDGPAIYIESGDKVFVTLADGSSNVLTDGASYALAEGEDEPNATLYSKSDLCLNGLGSLTIKSAYAHAVNSKDDLVITGGSYVVESADDALRGKDCVKILDGQFDLTSGGDAIKSNNDEDATRGFVSIDGGSFKIQSGDDGVNAFAYYRVTGGIIDMTAAGDAFKTDADGCIAGGDIVLTAGDDAFHAEYSLYIDGGTIQVDSCVEGYEAERVYVNDGETHIISSDDALNAAAPETTAVPKDGYLTSVTEPTEEESTATEEAVGTDPMLDIVDTCLIQINGGYVVLDAQGDAIDSNGYVEITGGVLLAEGPTGSADGTFDYGISATVSGGTVLMTGSVGMAQSFTGGTQPFALVQVSGKAGESLALITQDGEGGSGEVLASYTPKRDYQMAIVSSPDLVDGTQYGICVGAEISGANADGYVDGGTASGGTTVQFSASTASGGMGMMGGMGGRGDMGGMPDAGTMPDGTAPDGRTMPDANPPDGTVPDAGTMPDGTAPDGSTPPSLPDGALGDRGDFTPPDAAADSTAA